MAAPKGNQFWKLRSKHGRDKLFASPELMFQAACEYFEWCDKNPWVKQETTTKEVSDKKTPKEESKTTPTARPYTITALCLYLGCSSKYFTTFKATLKNENKDFLEVITRIEDIIYTQKFEGAAVGSFNANIIARDLGLKDRQDLTSGDESLNNPLVINVDKKKLQL